PRRPLQSVLIDTDRVAEIGPTMGPVDVSEVIDLGGRYLLRGLWDRHVHFDQWAQVISEVGKVSDDTADAWCRSASRTAASRGVVGVVDMEKPGPLEAWRRRMAGGDRLLRVAASVWPERLDAAIAGRLHTGDVIAGTVRIPHAALVVDGGVAI